MTYARRNVAAAAAATVSYDILTTAPRGLSGWRENRWELIYSHRVEYYYTNNRVRYYKYFKFAAAAAEQVNYHFEIWTNVRDGTNVLSYSPPALCQPCPTVKPAIPWGGFDRRTKSVSHTGQMKRNRTQTVAVMKTLSQNHCLGAPAAVLLRCQNVKCSPGKYNKIQNI